MLFADAQATLTDKKRSRDGYLTARVRFARAGLYRYGGDELDRPDLPAVSVYRPVDEVFSARAMRSFAGRPITNEHPADAVSAQNWRRHAIGEIGNEIWRDGEFVAATITVRDADAIRMIEDGKAGLSAGYTCSLQWGDGTADGKPFQATQRGIVGNHVAVVWLGRAGHHCRIG